MVRALRFWLSGTIALVVLQFVLLLSVDLKSQHRERFSVKVVEMMLEVPAQLIRILGLGSDSVGSGDAAIRFAILFAGFGFNAALAMVPLLVVIFLCKAPNRQSPNHNRQSQHGRS